MTAPTLTVRQLNRATLERQMLLRRERAAPLDVIEHLVGMQAQNPGDPYLALRARIEGFDPIQLSDLIAAHRAVRVVMLLRTTIHLVSDRDCLSMRSLLAPVALRQWGYSPPARRLADADIDGIVAAGRTVIEERPRTASEVGSVLAERWPDRDAEALAFTVRCLVPLVQVPPRGLWGGKGRPVLDTVEHWLGAPLDPSPSVEALVLRYLAAFGPASVKDVQVWSWLAGIREVVDRLRPRLRTFRDDGGRELFDLPDAPRPDPDVPAPVRVLPEYDNLLLSHDDRSRVGDPALKGRPWWRGSILVDGFLAATWRLDRERERSRMRIGLYRSLADQELADVEAEATAVLGFLAADAPERGVEIELLPA